MPGWKAPAFHGLHEPDDARVSRPESVSGSGRNSPGRRISGADSGAIFGVTVVLWVTVSGQRIGLAMSDCCALRH